MLFTHLGRIVAFIALVAGSFYVLVGLMIATGVLAPEQAVLARYFSSKFTTSGAVIDRGQYIILFAIALGILTEISFSVRKT
jgi:hypothetical protein